MSFDEEELILLIGSLIACVIGVGYWATALRPVSRLGCHPLHRAPIYLSCLAGFLVLGLVIWRWADQQIRADFGYILLVYLIGGAFLTAVVKLLPWFGISLREDALERRNLAAVIALSGVLFGVLITYAGANVGAGPSFWNNVYSGLLATGALLVCWLVVLSLGGAAWSIADHDVAAGLRLGLLMVALGLLLARAVAGDWKSVAATNRDFIGDGGIALILTLVAVGVEWMLRGLRHKVRPSVWSRGLLPGFSYLCVAVVWIVHLGWWKGFRW